MTALLDLVLVTGVVLMDALLLAGFVALILYFGRQWRRRPNAPAASARGAGPHTSQHVALTILDERYARGEIDAAELAGRRALLRRER